MTADLRHALRSLRRSPAFTAAAIATIALGIGANAGAFSALHALLLKPLPYPDPDRLVELYETTVDGKPRGVAMANLLDWRAGAASFTAMAVYQPRSFGLTFGAADAVNVIQTGMVMAGFFEVLRVPPSMGRVFREEEEVREEHLIVLTDRLWRKLFAADPGAAGRKVLLNEEPFTVIGVMPAGFEYPIDRTRPDAFIPLSRRDYCCGRLGLQTAIARVAPGVGLDRADAELQSAAQDLAAQYRATNGGRTARLRPLGELMTGARREPLFLLLAATALLLLIAFANVMGLVLARCFARARETSIRIALGAGLGRLARHYLPEAAMLGAAGAIGGAIASELVLRAIPAMIPGSEVYGPLRLDSAVRIAAIVLGILITALLAIAPLLHARSMRGGAVIPRSRGRVRGALVIAQAGLSVILLLNTALLLRSFLHLLATSPGFETAHAWRFAIGLPEKRYDTDLKLIAFHRDLQARLAAVPGVEAAGFAGRLPLRGGAVGPGGTFQIAGSNLPVPQRPRSWVNTASPGYFAAMGIRVVEGREFSWQDDRPRQHRVAIVNQTFARQYLSGRRAIGTLLDVRWISELNPDGSQWEIVGIAGDTRQANLDHDPIPEIFLSMTQVGADGAAYVIRARSDDSGMPRAIAAAVAAQDPRIQRVTPERLSLVVERNLGGRSAAVQLAAAFGSLALLLTAVGIYGIVSFRATERLREMAIRSALGATTGEIRRLVLMQGVRVAAGGTAAGLAGFLIAGRYLQSQLFGVKLSDPISIGATVAAIFAAALGASFAPGRRAGNAQPMELLRDA